MGCEILVHNVLKHFGGISKNNLNELLHNVDDLDNALSIASDSPYVDTSNLINFITPFSQNFSVLGLNVQCLNSKFDQLKILLDELSKNRFEFSAICLQETWVDGENCDMSQFDLSNYTSIHLPATCSSHGGCLIHLHKQFQFVV